jgi:predicted MPP superfamily phosphohydrolase
MRARAGAFQAWLGGFALAGMGWGWFEAGWVRFRRIELPVPGVTGQVRIVHLSDFHLGIPSRGARAVARAVDWAADQSPDLVCITGDLVSRPRGEPVLRKLLHPLPNAYAVLGNHDVAYSRDPFSHSAGLTELEPARLLVDEAATVDVRGMRVQLVGVDPRTYRTRRAEPWRLADPSADIRILLCHFPRIFEQLPPGSFDVVLAGHMHDGQISLPLPRDKLRLAHVNAPFTTGVYSRDGMWMHVSPGLGTTFVPFRFYARPEATELVLQRRP